MAFTRTGGAVTAEGLTQFRTIQQRQILGGNVSGKHDGEFSERVARAAETFAWNTERREAEEKIAKTDEHTAIAEQARFIAGANSSRPVEFMSAIEVVADTQVWSLRLHYGTANNDKTWTNLVQLSSGQWCLENYTGTWEPSKGPLDEWCVKVLSGQIEREDDGIPF